MGIKIVECLNLLTVDVFLNFDLYLNRQVFPTQTVYVFEQDGVQLNVTVSLITQVKCCVLYSLFCT